MLKSAAEQSLAALAGAENTEERKISNAIEKGKGSHIFITLLIILPALIRL